MINPNNQETPRQSADTIAAARVLGIDIEVVPAATPPDIDQAFDALSSARPARF